MRLVSAALDAEVLGTSVHDFIEASVFRGGELVAGPFKLGPFSLGWAASRQVQGQATITIPDDDGSLSPWGMGDALAPGGSRVSLTWVSGATAMRVPMGLWRIREARPQESWRMYGGTTKTVLKPDHSTATFTFVGGGVEVDAGEGTYTIPDAYVTVDEEAGTFTVDAECAVGGGFVSVTTTTPALIIPGGGSVTLRIDEDVTATAGLERIDAAAPIRGASALSEMARLIQRFGAIDDTDAPDDVTIQSSYTAFPKSRLDALDELADMMGARFRVGPDGALQVVPSEGVGPVWTIQGGQGGALIGAGRVLSDADVFNHFVSTGATSDGREVVGRAFVDGGPLAWDGPFGRVPVWHESTATSVASAITDATTTRDAWLAGGEIDLPVTCLAHPGLQVNDLVTLIPPTTAGEQSLVGRVVGMVWSSVTGEGGTTPGKSMDLTVRVSTDALEAVAARVRRG